jgi:hypothetical protein
MINSLRDYLTNKELTTEELTSALNDLESGLDRAGMEKLLAKLRRRPDKAKEEGLGQDVPSDLTPQDLANGFYFDKSKDGKTWSAENEDGLVEVSEKNGKWFTRERSGGNAESGYTRESEKQHDNAQEAFEYAADVAGHNWDQSLFEDLSSNREQGLGQAAPSTKMAEDATDAQYGYVSSMLNSKEVPEELATAAKQAIEDRNLTKAQVGEIIGKMRELPDKEGFDPNAPTQRMIDSVKRNIVAKGLSKEDQDAILQDLPNMDKATMSELIGRLKAMDDVNAPEEGLSQADSSNFDSEVDSVAKELDAVGDNFIEGKDLIDRVNDFKNPKYDKYVGIQVQVVNDIRAMANDSSGSEDLKARINKIADKLESDLIDRFGLAEVTRTNDEGDEISLSDVKDSVEAEKAMYFETDTEKLIDHLNTNDSYGDVKSGGAEIFINQEEDGTYTATVDYDRDSEQFKSKDRDEVVQQAAVAAADYNLDVIPSSYYEDADLEKEAKAAKTPEEAMAFADKLDQLANDLENNRGDRQVAADLKQYGDRIRALADKNGGVVNTEGLEQQSPKA